MNKKKTIQELTIKDNFMFGAVMCDENNCTPFLEMVLGFPIKRLVISKEKSMLYHPEYKGVRLDIYANDEKNTHYNVEMQVSRKPALGRRARYYHSQVDMELLESGEGYENLPNAFVIFVCDFDPFGEKRYCYTFENRCLENGKLPIGDGCRTIFLSTKGENPQEVSAGLVKFLNFVAADLEESEKDFEDTYVKQLQNSVLDIKRSREMGERYMTLEEWLRDEKEEGRREGKRELIFEFLKEFGTIPKELEEKINGLEDEEGLKLLVKKAAKADSLESFEKEAGQLFLS